MLGILKRAAETYTERRGARLAAAFTFYALLSLAPALVLAIGIAGIFLDRASAQATIVELAGDSFGPAQAEFISSLLRETATQESGVRATLLSLPVLLLGASSMFAHLHEATNVVWDAFDPRAGFKGMALQRLFGVLLVLLAGIVLVAWLSLDAGLGYATTHARSMVDVGFPLFRFASFLVGLLFWGLVFSLMLRGLPAPRLTLRDVAPSAIVMAATFGLGRHLIALYFQYSNFSAAYGAAGAIVVLLLWIYFSSQMYFFCVALSRVWAEERGSLAQS